ncbi:MAG: hypothetical protein CHACPFDD_00180 [Phycisphaerae bacterium]|nr:hypothetical protein [Phycisphaerae bacterium]
MLPRTTLIVATTVSIVATTLAGSDGWQFVSSPNGGDYSNLLRDVTGMSPNDVWAVGTWSPVPEPFHGTTHYTLILHYDGGAWSVVPSPNLDDRVEGYNDLTGIAARAADDVWAVGVAGSSASPMVLHFDGQQWSPEAAPPNNGSAFLWKAAAVGPQRQIWAVGGQNGLISQAPFIPLVARLNGDTWESLAGVTVGALRTYFYSVDGMGPNDVWAVGTWGHNYGEFRVLIEHFDGVRWRAVNYPTPGLNIDSLTDVVAVAPDDVWAVGYYYHKTHFTTQPLILHYDGNDWTQVDLPPFLDGAAELRAVTARGASEVYAAGTYADAEGIPRPFILKYDGAQWAVDTPAVTDGLGEWFFGLGAIPGGDLWAVGEYFNGSAQSDSPLTERLAGTRHPGDMNCDGSVNGFDVDGFVLALSDPAGYATQYPDCDIDNGDVNADGSVNGFDVDGFVALLGG